MTYTFKLARRLAVARRSAVLRNYTMPAVLALLVACAAGETIAPDQLTWRDRTAAAVSVSPTTLVLETNQAARFVGRVRALYGDDSATEIEWTANGGTITDDGLFRAAKVGTYKVVGRGRGREKADTATVLVVAPDSTLVAITIAPSSVALETGATQPFTATGRLSDGTTTPVGVTWTATGGTIDAGGTYGAGLTAGTYRVIATTTDRTLADTATVTIAAPALAPTPTPTLTQVVLNPSSKSLLTGATQQFAVYGRMSNGDSVAVTVTYSATGGTVTSGGLYTAGTTAGSYRVIAKATSGPADTAAITLTAPVPSSTPSGLSGIPFGPFHLPFPISGSNSLPKYPYFSGMLYNGEPSLSTTDPKYVLNELAYTKSKGKRMVLNMAVGPHSNWITDGAFDMGKWKAAIDKFRGKGIEPYIADGTIIAHYIIDEPNCSSCRGGAIITPAMVDEMAAYSKSIWPNLPTVVRVVPAWFKSYGTPRYVDAAWAQWEGPLHIPSYNLTAEQFRDRNVTDAQSVGLGLIFSMNILDGGDGSSGIPGYTNSPTRWQMSASEVERVGSVLAASSYACGVFAWKYNSTVNDNPVMVTAMSRVAAVAGNRSGASCVR